MIAKHIAMHSLKKSSFAGLVDYITDAQNKDHRLGEVTLTNCAGHDVEMATLEILATQQQNTRAQSDKTFHLLVSFRPDEKPDAATLKAIEAKLCEGLGFGEHQRISAVHHDTDNLHIHIAINKIHPERLTIHEPYYPYKTLAKLCANLEQEYGLQVDNHEPKRTVAEGRALDMEHHSGIESLLGWIQRECLPQIKAADSWQKLHEVAQENGLSLRVKANGVVFESQKTGVQVKASSIARDLSKSKLEARLGDFEAAQIKPLAPVTESATAPVIDIKQHSAQRTTSVNPQPPMPPKKQYEKKPIGFRVDTTLLYARYQNDQRRRAQVQKSTLAGLRQQKQQRIDAAKQSAREQREAIKRRSGGFQSKQALYRKASSALLGTIADINNQYRQACKTLHADNSRHTWADWLRRKAIAGDSEALTALRSRRPQANKNRVIARPSKQAAGTVGLGVSVPTSPYKAAPMTDNITKEGTVIYRMGASPLREDAGGMQVAGNASPQAIQHTLRFAAQRYGNPIAVQGNLTFKAQLIRAAVDGGLPVTFADPLLEKKRQALSGKNHAQPSGQSIGRGQAGCGAVEHGQQATHASRATDSAHTNTNARNARQHGGHNSAGQSHLGRAGTPPPPVARDRMRGLSERALAGLQTGIEMLLPPVVSVFLRQSGTEADSLLRRGRGLFADVVNQTKKALQEAKTQSNTQSNTQGQGGGRGL